MRKSKDQPTNNHACLWHYAAPDYRLSFLSLSRYASDPETGARELASMLTDQKIFVGVHPGDLYGILIDHFGRQEKYKQVSEQQDIDRICISFFSNTGIDAAGRIAATSARTLLLSVHPSEFTFSDLCCHRT